MLKIAFTGRGIQYSMLSHRVIVSNLLLNCINTASCYDGYIKTRCLPLSQIEWEKKFCVILFFIHKICHRLECIISEHGR